VILPGSVAGLRVPEEMDAPVTAMEDGSQTIVFTPTDSEQIGDGLFDPTGDESATEVIAPVASPKVAHPDLPQGYQLLSRLSQGSTGTVYKAKQIAMERIVALKIMSGELATDEAYVKRFVREGRASAQLNHPNIVRAFDIGRSGKRYYFASEFVDGGSLK
jgi:serine/threonine protein kinase